MGIHVNFGQLRAPSKRMKISKKLGIKNKIREEYTVAEAPEQIGVAERHNLALVETTRSLLIELKLQQSYWFRTVDIVAYVHNLDKKYKN